MEKPQEFRAELTTAKTTVTALSCWQTLHQEHMGWGASQWLCVNVQGCLGVNVLCIAVL